MTVRSDDVFVGLFGALAIAALLLLLAIVTAILALPMWGSGLRWM
jgi:hypothetical protein